MMTAPLDVTEGNRKRKQLLEQLARQAGLQRGGPARPVFGGGRPFFAFSNLPAAPRPQLTRPFPIPPGLANRLGPGGVGIPQPGEFSPGPGIPAPNLPSPPGPPQPGAPLGGATPPDPTLGAAPAPAPADATSAPSSASYEDVRSGDYRTLMHAPGASADELMAGSLIPLGGGVYYNPATGTFHGENMASAGDAIRASQALGRQGIA